MAVIIITLLATFSMQLGYLLWKVAADSLPKIGKEKFWFVVKGFLMNTKWVIGYLATTIGWLLLVKALDIGEISLVQPLMSVGDVFLIAMAVFFLKEKLLKFEWVGLFFIVAGATSLSFDVKDISTVNINWPHIYAYFSVALLVWITLMIARKKGRLEIILALTSGVSFGIGGAFTKLMTTYLTTQGQQLESMYFVVNPFFPLMVIANIAGLVLLQMAFQNGRAAIVVPVQLAVLNIMSVIAGVTLFSEMVSLYRISCIILIISGTYILQLVGSHKPHSVFSQV